MPRQILICENKGYLSLLGLEVWEFVGNKCNISIENNNRFVRIEIPLVFRVYTYI